MSNMTWGFGNLWNTSLEQGRPEKPLQQRQRIWGSELGGSMVDRFLKMKAVKQSNPPNNRSLRKFEAGNIWEALIGYVLSRAGILINKQQWVGYQYPTLLEVSGKLDFIAGGKPDYDKASSLITTEFKWLPEFISRATLNIVSSLQEQFPDGLKEIILELKSCSAFMFEKYERSNEGSIQHKLQLFHYLKAMDYKEGHIVYICKDDARLLEIGVFNPSFLEEVYKKDIETMTNYVLTDTQPPLEKPIVFDEMFSSFSANWKVGYSSYLFLLYGLKDQAEFDEKYKPITERWNRVLTRIKSGDKMTDNNLAAIDEMKKEGFDVDEITKRLKENKNGI